ncbi:MAG: hypothetical protein AAB497_03560 [Patescibacteria group bacterium]
MDEKVKKEMAKVILEEILGKPIPRKKLKGKKTKEEKEVIKLLTKLHENAKKRKSFGGIFFAGDKKARVTRG